MCARRFSFAVLPFFLAERLLLLLLLALCFPGFWVLLNFGWTSATRLFLLSHVSENYCPSCFYLSPTLLRCKTKKKPRLCLFALNLLPTVQAEKIQSISNIIYTNYTYYYVFSKIQCACFEILSIFDLMLIRKISRKGLFVPYRDFLRASLISFTD